MKARPSPDPVLIVGGGIGGLAAAIALARAGIPSRVLERASAFEEVGAGIQLGPNATRHLQAWGAFEHLAPDAVRPRAIHLHDGLSGGTLNTVPLGAAAAERFGAAYVVLHRGELLRALLDMAAGMGTHIELLPGFDVADLRVSAEAADVRCSDGRALTGRAVVAADGVASTLRAKVAPNAILRWTGKTAWRALLPAGRAPDALREPDIHVWMGPRGHLVHYPVLGGRAVNVVAITEGTPGGGLDWNEAGESDRLEARFADWAEAPRRTIARADGWRRWPLYELPPLKTWAAGRLALLGDAAHPVLPFLAQGAALAIEDAAALARALAETASVPAALDAYARTRRERACRVQRAARRMGRIYHLRGPARLARNLVLKTRSPESLLEGFRWLYASG